MAAQLPIWPWVKAVSGFGPLNLAAIVGEAGDISRYRNPSCLWKRLGLAVIDGEKQGKRTNAEEALVHGYSPRRRCVAYLLGDTMIKVGDKCRYRSLYNERKERMLPIFTERGDKAPKLHSHRDAMRIMVKRTLRDMWVEWKKLDGTYVIGGAQLCGESLQSNLPTRLIAA